MEHRWKVRLLPTRGSALNASGLDLREEYKSTHTQVVLYWLLRLIAECTYYVTHAPENTYMPVLMAGIQRRPHSLTINQYEFLGKNRQDTSSVNTSLEAWSSKYAAVKIQPVATIATSLSLLAEIHRQMHLRCWGRRWLLVNWFWSCFVLSNWFLFLFRLGVWEEVHVQ